MISKTLALLGYASGLAANNPGCGDGPLRLQALHLEKRLSSQGIPSHWQAMLELESDSSADRLTQVAALNQRLAVMTRDLTQKNQAFLVLGGDHSSAIGTWSGVSAAVLGAGGSLGLIWVDAHMDSHTVESTPSGHIHGMPLAALLGYGDAAFTNLLFSKPKLKPEHVSLIGVRSFESEEAALLHRLGVRIYDMPAIKQQGLTPILREAIARAKQGTVGFGVSLDLDAIDPQDAPGVGVPEPDGIPGQVLCQALTLLQQEKQLLGLEIVEYNPHRDVEHKTEQLIQKLVLSILKE